MFTMSIKHSEKLWKQTELLSMHINNQVADVAQLKLFWKWNHAMQNLMSLKEALHKAQWLELLPSEEWEAVMSTATFGRFSRRPRIMLKSGLSSACKQVWISFWHLARTTGNVHLSYMTDHEQVKWGQTPKVTYTALLVVSQGKALHLYVFPQALNADTLMTC